MLSGLWRQIAVARVRVLSRRVQGGGAVLAGGSYGGADCETGLSGGHSAGVPRHRFYAGPVTVAGF
jgi:hypothetical protein